MKFHIPLVAALLAGFSTQSPAADYYLMVGGGPTPSASEFSIEQNVLWLQPMLDARGFAAGETWFASGAGNQLDVVYHDATDPQSRYWEPIARVFGEWEANTLRYQANRVQNNTGSSTAENVSQALEARLSSLKSGDSLLLIYSGHGSFETPRSRNALRLWGNTAYSAADLSSQLAKAPAGSQVRYVLPQCFSGAFVRSVFTQPDNPGADTLMPGHCGFVSVPDNRESEGCTPAVDAEDYRDYASYFFAALDGKNRVGEALTTEPDLDGDGKVSLLEAHYYAFTEAQSTDVPHSTSEYFLELTQPWYARWLPAVSLSEDNPYLKVAHRLAERLSLEEINAAEITRLRAELEATEQSVEAQMAALKKDEQRQRQMLRKEFELHWPGARTSYSGLYARFVQEEHVQALQWIRQHSHYPTLVDLQNQIDKTELELLEKQRASAQVEKLQRALYMGSLYEHVRDEGNTQRHKKFDDLRTCESWVLPGRD